MGVRHSLRKLLSTGELLSLVILCAFMVRPQPATAHHSFASLYSEDGEEVIEVLEGSVRVFRLLNPHGALILDVTDETGTTEGWLIELSPASQLAREGWTDDLLSADDKVTIAVFTSVTPNRGRLRALLVPGPVEGEAAQLLVSYGIRGDTRVMRRLRERLPVCGTIDASFNRTECFRVDATAMLALDEEFPGHMGYVMP